MRASVGIAVAIALAGCRTEQTIITPDPHLDRMLDQPKRMPYQPDPILPGGLAMQVPPGGTMPADAPIGQPLVTLGVANGKFAERIPIPVDRRLVEMGRARFDVFCATCHGMLGDGVSAVATKMALRKPPSLHVPPAKADVPGQLFETIRDGYGLMPSYAVQLSVTDTWAVVAYVRALQLARSARVSGFPPDARERLAKEAP